MATHSSTFAWRIPWTEEPDGLQSQFSSVTQSCPILCDPMDCSTPVFPVFYQLPELAQTYVHWGHPTISSSVIPFSSCLQSFPQSGSFLISRFFASGGQSIGASVQPQSFQWIFRIDFLQDWLVWSPCSPWDFQESSPTPQSKSISSSALRFLYSPTLTYDYWKNHSFD